MDSQFGRVVVETLKVHFRYPLPKSEALKQYIITVEVTALKTDSQEEQSLLLDSLSPYCSILSIEAKIQFLLKKPLMP